MGNTVASTWKYVSIGQKIKILASVLRGIYFSLGIILWIRFITDGEQYRSGYEFETDNDWIGWVILAFAFLSFISTWFIEGFGELVENSDIIAEEHKRVNEKHEKAVAKNNEKKQAQRKKQIKANIENPNFDEDEYIDITCANCKAELSFTKGQLQSGEELTCPMCDAHISV